MDYSGNTLAYVMQPNDSDLKSFISAVIIIIPMVTQWILILNVSHITSARMLDFVIGITC